MIEIEISIGELIDRLSILDIKAKRFKLRESSSRAKKEYDDLIKKIDKLPVDKTVVFRHFKTIKTVNKKLWDLENTIRKLERQSEFGEEFVDVSRKIRQLNDKRSVIKDDINKLLVGFAIDLKEYK